MNNLIVKIIIVTFIGIVFFLTFNKHSTSGYFNYHSELWADKAGYYVYLPAATKFNFNPNYFPDSIDIKTGFGFTLDYKNNKVITKYTLGVALLQLPFYLIADLFSNFFNFIPNGFSPIYHWSVNVASVFYLMLGLFYLQKYLRFYFKNKIVYLVLMSIFLATNLFYYSVEDTGMSHVYSFSMFCIFLYTMQKTNFLVAKNILTLALFGILCGFIVLIRPTNVVFLFTYFFLNIDNTSEISSRLKRLLNPKVYLPILLGGITIILPQLIYWKYAYGSLITYSYGTEGFNWIHPKLLQTWFSPNNGLFVYSPFYLIIIIALFYMIIKNKASGVFILCVFLSISYLFSSWHQWNFGCSFGARSYVEYLSIFSIPIAHFYTMINDLNKLKNILFWIFVIVIVVINLKMTYKYDVCFYGSNDWDWNTYLKLLLAPPVIKFNAH